MIGEQTIKTLGANLKKNLRKELRDQGHYLTGKLDASVDEKYSDGTDHVGLTIEALDYIDQVNEGIPGNQIDVNDLNYIGGLTEYVKKRFGISNDRRATRIAFQIAAKHRREGMPTRNSYQFSATGERTEAIETSYNSHARQNELIIDNAFSGELDTLINKTFDKTIF